MSILDLFRKKEAPKPEETLVKGAFDSYLEDFKAQEQAEKWQAPGRLSEAKKDEILNSYFKNAPKLVTTTGKKAGYAMDSNDYGFCKDGLVTSYGRSDDRIFTYYAQHGFLGWQICAIIAQHWLVNLAISVPVDDAIRPGWKITINSDDEKGESQEEQDAGADLYDITSRKYHTADKARQLLKRARIFGVGYALICFDGVNYEEPYNKDGIKPGSFRGVSIIEPYWITPQWMNNALNDPASPNFYEPEFYYVQGLGKVHKSHIIKVVHDEVADILKPSYYFGGVPLTQQIYERIYAAERVANEAPLLALTKRLLVVPTNLRALAEKPQIMGKLINMLVNGRDNQGIYFTEEGEKSAVHQVDTSLSDFDQLILTQYQLVACVAKMPAHKLLKTDPKGLNNNGGYTLKDYAQELMSLQENKLRPFVERVNEATLYSDMPELKGAKMVTTFEPVDAPTELEKAQTEQVKVNSDVALVQSGILAPEEVRDILRNDKDSKYAGIAEEMPAQEMPEDLLLPDDNGNSGEELPEGLNPFSQDENPNHDPKNGQFAKGHGASTKAHNLNIDFSTDNVFPKINEKDAKELGVKALPVRLKKKIIDRQREIHPETEEEANEIISGAVYSPDVKIPGKTPGYMHFIKQIEDDSNSLVLLDLQESDDGYYDIVHYFKVDDRNKKRIERQAKKEANTEGR